MNALLAAMAVANPVFTALLTIIVFLEKDKIRKRSKDIEATLMQGNSALIQAIRAQKEDFINIVDRLELLSKDSEKSAATFINLSTALTQSSSVSAKALGGVTDGLQKHASSVSALATELLNQMTISSEQAIASLSENMAESLKIVAKDVSRVEQAQVASKEASTQAIAELATKSAESLKLVGDEIKKVEQAQVASKEASTQAIAELATKSAESLKLVGDEIKKVEQAQVASLKASTESIKNIASEIARMTKSIKDLQEALKTTVTL